MAYPLEKGDKYSIPVCAVEGYQLNTDKYPSGSTGTFSGKDTTITFVYKPLASQKTIIHYKPTNSSWKSIQCYAYTDDGEEPLGAGTFKAPRAYECRVLKGRNMVDITIRSFL